MPRRIIDPYEVLGLDHGATEAEVRTAYRRLVKKHHPDKNHGDQASEWIFKEIQRAYETLRDAKDVRSAGQEQPSRAQADRARTWSEQRQPPPGDRAERDQQERAEHDRQRQQRSERTGRGEYKPREQQQAPAAGSGPEPTCHCVVRWWTRLLPQIVRLIGAWVKWALCVAFGTFIYGFFLVLGVSALAWLLSFLWLPLVQLLSEDWFALGIFGLGFGVALWVVEKPRVCQQCGCISSGCF